MGLVQEYLKIVSTTHVRYVEMMTTTENRILMSAITLLFLKGFLSLEDYLKVFTNITNNRFFKV